MSSADTSKVTEHWEYQAQQIRIGDIATRDVARIGRSRTLGEAAALMAERRISSVIVTDSEGHPWGVLTERDILRAMDEERPGTTQLADFMSAPVITVPPSMPMEAAYQLALREGVRHLVLVDEEDQVAGVVSETDFRLHLQLSLLAGRRSVLSVMGHTVLTLPPDASLRQAVHLMDCRRASCVVVIEAECPVGIITERDIARAYAAGNDLQERRIADFMTCPVTTIPSGTTINEAAEYMLATRIRHLIVVDAAGRLVGLLDEHDLLRSMNETLLDARLENERAYLRGLFDAIPDPVWLKSPEGVYLACNDQLDKLLNLPKAQILGKVDTDLVSADAAQILRASDLAVMEMEAACITEESLNLVNRQAVFEVIKTPMHDTDGNLIGVLGIARDITDRKRLEQEIQDAEVKYRHLVEQSLVGIYIIRDGSFLYVNPGFADMFGFGSAEEIIGRVPLSALVAPEDRTLVNNNLEARLSGRISEIRYEFRGLRADGRRIDIEAHGRALTYNGQPACIGICLDVSGRKQAESREKARADFLDAMVRGEPLPALLERLVHALEAQIAGTLCSILLYDPVAQTLHIGAAPHLPDFYNEAIEGLKVGFGVGSCGTAVWEGRRVVCEDLRTHPYWQPFQAIVARAGLGACWSEPILDAGGKVLGTFAVYGATPRTPTGEELESLGWAVQLACLAIERRAMERRLAESEAHFRALADSGQALVWTSGLDQRRNYFNQPWLKFTGQSLEQALGEGYLAAIHPEDRERLQHTCTDAFERREPFSFDYRLRRHDGEYRWMQAEGAPRYDSRGEFAGFIGHCIDITERKQDQRDLEASRTRLQRILELAPLPLCYVDGNGRLVFRNQRFLELMGYTEAEVPTLAEWWTNAYPEADYRQWVLDTWGMAVEQARLTGGDITPVTYRVTCKNGEVRIFEISGITLGEDFLATFIDLTERVSAEAALRENEAYLRTIIDNEPQCIKLLDRDGSLLDMNPAGLAMIEADSLEQVRGRQVCQLVSPDDCPGFAAMVEAVFRGERQSLIFSITGLKGMRRYLETHSVPLWDSEHRQVRALLGVTQDITERKKAEEQLRESEARFRGLFEQAAVGVALVDAATGCFVRVNQAFSQIVGYPLDEILNLDFQRLTHPDDVARDLASVALLRSGELGRYQAEKRYVTKQGRTVWVHLTVSPLWTQGEPIGHNIAIVQDITERKNAQQAIIESEQRFRGLFEQFPVAYQSLDIQGRFIDVNPRLCELLGYTREELLGMTFDEVWRDDARACFPAEFENFQQNSWISNEIALTRKDGQQLTVLLEGRIQRDAEGCFVRTHCILADISERKQAEETLRASEHKRLQAQYIARMGDFEWDLATGEVTWSDGMYRLLGYDPNERFDLATVNASIHHPDELERVTRWWRDGMATGVEKLESIEYRVLRKDGRIIHIQTNGWFERQGDKVTRLYGTCLDITERKAAEAALEQTRLRLEEAQKIAHLGSFEYDAATQRMVWSIEEYNIYGLNPMEPPPAYDAMLTRCIHPDDAALLDQTFRQALASRAIYEFEHRIQRPDGSLRCVYDRALPYFDGEGTLLRYVGVTLDITDRKLAEEKLRESEIRFRALFESAGDALMLANQRGFIHCNQATLNLFGCAQAEEFLGRHPAEFSPPLQPCGGDSMELAWQHMDDALRGHTTPFEWRHKRLNGDEFPAEVLLSPVILDGEPMLFATVRDISERKQAEARLKESEERFRALFEFSNDAIFIMHEGRCIDCNDKTLELYGCARSDIIGATPIQYSPARQPDGADSSTKASGLIEAALAGQPQHFEWRHTRRDGTEFDAEVSLNAFGFGGNILLQSVVRDITERKQAEMQVRKLAQVVEQSPEAILITDREGAIEYVNLAFTDTTGYMATEAIGQNPRFLGSPKTPPEVFADLWRTLSLGESWKGEFWNRAKDGREYLESAHITPIRQADGSISHYVGIQEDITAKKELEQKLNLYRDRLEELVAERTRDLENAHQQLGETFDAMSRAGIAVYWVAFDDGRLLEVNDRACQMLGYSREELLTLTVPQLDPNYPPEGYSAVMSQVAQDRRLCIQTENRHKDGHLIPIEVNIYLPESEAVKPRRIVAFITDISLRKAAEQALIDARRAAEATSRAKSEFLANMSHEIRTPMNAILGLSHLLGQSDLAPAHHDLVAKIHSAGDSLLGIINEILDFSKIEAGRMQIEQAPFRLSRLLDKLATLGSAAIGQKDIEYLIGPVPNEAENLQGDALRLEQVLVNLISNAAKFTQTGEIRLDIAIVKAWNHRLELRFEVRDTGIGIQPELQEHIFMPFSQADSSTTRRYGGTGLGLSICQRLVALMGGTIGLESVPGVGSTFWFTVALGRAEPEEMPQLELSTQRVLVVDDHPLALETLAGIVRSLGWEVETEPSGEAAVARFTRCPPDERSFDIILMDWKMPGMDGLSACQAIRNLQGPQAAPLLVMVTAYERERLLAEPGSRHVDAVLGKPLLASALFDTVAQVKLARTSVVKAMPKARSPGRLAGWRILVTDDNEINRDVARLNLESEGATVHLAENGQQALDWLEARSGAVDVVLMDVQMPVMDGYEATRRIREKPACKGLPIVALSAGVFQEHQAAALAAGMDGFIGKPFNPDEMVELLLWLVKSTRPSSVPPKAPKVIADAAEMLALDVDKALRIWRSPSKYQDKLRVFVDTHGGDATAIARLAGLGEWADAAALAHRLKGVAGNLALLEVQRQVQQVESELRAGAVGEESLRGLDQAMTMALSAIAEYVGSSPGVAASFPDRSGAQTVHLIHKLLSALALYSPEEAEPHLAALATRVTAEQLQPIRQAVEEFAFPEAEALTLGLAGTLGIQPDEIR